MCSTVGTGQVIAGSSLVEKVAQWQQTQGDQQQKALVQKGQETERRKKEIVQRFDQQDKITLRKESQQKDGRKGKKPAGECPESGEKPDPGQEAAESPDSAPRGGRIDVTV
jgi:hypothetical protein